MIYRCLSMQDCSVSIADALEILQSCIKPSICICSNRYFMIISLSFAGANSAKWPSSSSHPSHICRRGAECAEATGLCIQLWKSERLNTKGYRGWKWKSLPVWRMWSHVCPQKWAPSPRDSAPQRTSSSGAIEDLTDGKSTLVQVMACCQQAASHHLNNCWLKSPCHKLTMLSISSYAQTIAVNKFSTLDIWVL